MTEVMQADRDAAIDLDERHIIQVWSIDATAKAFAEHRARATEAQAAEIERKEVEIAALWALLDDIDTLDDVCKGDDYAFRIWVRPLQQKRFKIMSGERFDPLNYAARAALGETE